MQLGCPECETETEQRPTMRFPDGSGYAECQECRMQVVHMAGTIPEGVAA